MTFPSHSIPLPPKHFDRTIPFHLTASNQIQERKMTFHSSRMEPFHSCVRFGQKNCHGTVPFLCSVLEWGENGMATSGMWSPLYPQLVSLPLLCDFYYHNISPIFSAINDKKYVFTMKTSMFQQHNADFKST